MARFAGSMLRKILTYWVFQCIWKHNWVLQTQLGLMLIGLSLRLLRINTNGLPISDRELEVLEQVWYEKTDEEIAATLVISVATVKLHIHNILTKLERQSRYQAAIMAYKQGWIPLHKSKDIS
ncbi:response regulator transcription factor [Herpetosiphon sp. NSE202]|uniref:response regulator transcription factor n=1 Tax=Herpetosiphon sp. NSE202 TaxID=3351349 RepID=UPI00363FDE05